jgi:hypothetical protein
MSCTICSRETAPGDRLCFQCKAALKRVRKQTVSQVEPLRRRSKAVAMRPSVNNHAPLMQPVQPVQPVQPMQPPTGTASSRRMRLPVTLVVVGALICAVGYFGDHLPNANAVQDLARAAKAPAQAGSAPDMPTPLANPAPFRPVDDALPPRSSSGVAPESKTVAKPVGNTALKPQKASKLIAAVPSLTDFGPVTDAPVAVEPAVPAPAPSPPEAPPPTAGNPWPTPSRNAGRAMVSSPA